MKVPAFVEGLFRIIDLKKTGCFFFAVDVEDETNEKKQKIQYSWGFSTLQVSKIEWDFPAPHRDSTVFGAVVLVIFRWLKGIAWDHVSALGKDSYLSYIADVQCVFYLYTFWYFEWVKRRLKHASALGAWVS